MTNLVTKTYRIFGIEPRCKPGCGRTLSEAIAQQVEKQEECKHAHCKFKNEIKEAIIRSNNPNLEYFKTDKTEILDNELLTVSWKLKNAKNCILKGFGKIDNQGTKQIKLNKPTDLILEYKSLKGDLHKSNPLKINVYPTSQLISFNISKSDIIKGKSITISWKTKNVVKAFLKINEAESQVELNNSIKIIPEKDLKIELKLIGNNNSEIVKTRTVNVYERAKILSFSSDKQKVLSNDEINLKFDVRNASKILLSNSNSKDKIDVTYKRSINLTVRALDIKFINQIFYLEVFDLLNEPLPRSEIKIDVYPKPTIVNFGASQDNVLINHKVELKWSVINYSKILLDYNSELIDVSNISSYRVKLRKTSTFKLIVTSLERLKTIESKVVNIQLIRHVELKFSVDKTHIIETTAAKLSWRTANATHVYLNSENNPIDLSGTIMLYPNKTTEYSIIAVNELDKKVYRFIINVFKLPNIVNINLPHLPLLVPDISNSFIGGKSLSNKFKYTSLTPSEQIVNSDSEKILSYIDKNSTIEGHEIFDDVIKKNISTDGILDMIKQKLQI